jgi:hypothetical protein
VFTTLSVVLRVLGERAGNALRARPLTTNLQICAFVAAVGAVTFLVRFWCPVGWTVFHLQLGYYPLYVCMFVFGVWADRSSWLDELESTQVDPWFRVSAVSILLLPIVMALGGGLNGAVPGPS